MDITKMSDVELMAYVLGNKSEAKKLARANLAEVFGFNNHYDAKTVYGVSEPTASYSQSTNTKLQAIREIWVRCMASNLKEYTLCDDQREIGQFLCTKFAGKKREVMACLFLDNSHKILHIEEMFSGTINSASVHARPIAQKALEVNAAAVILVHNHLSAEVLAPSCADMAITDTIRSALRLLDIRLLDHFIVCGNKYTSFAEKGLM